ncbi:MAG: BACON domain-containing protein [Bacteroidota bacterium]|nr:BACON domain-containing protein [Bacteroidota bacterium]
MKLRHLFVSILAAAGLLMTSCQEKEKDLGLPEIKITQNELALDQNVNSVNLNVYATRNWTVSTAADWISVNPSKGSAYQETAVTVTVLENAGYNRVGTVKFDIGYDSKTLTINQTGAQGEKSEGSGTMTDPYTVAGVLAFIQTLGTETSENAVYIKGKVAAVTLTYEASGTYGNARFTMVDEGSTDPFTAYNVLYLGNKKWSAGQTDIKEGDEVIVCSKVFNYGGKTPETASGGYLYSLNGETAGGGSGDEAKGTGTLDDPYNPAGAAAAVANLSWTSTTDYQTTDPVYVKGKISKIADKGTYTDGGTYGNATFYITETGESTGTEFYVYRILYLGNKKYESGKTDIKVGDEVIIYGKLMNYKGNTPETASGCYLYSLNGDTGTGGGGGNDNPDVIFSEAFTSSQGSFTIDNKNLPSALSAIWEFSSQYSCMKATAYVSSTKTNYESESWLISPEIDLTAQTTAFLSFDHAGNYFGTKENEATLHISADGGTTWTAVAIPTYFTNYTFVSSGEISLASYVGKKIKIAFRYTSTSTKAGTWEVQNVKVYKTSTGGGQGGGGGEGNKIKFKKVTTVTSGKTYIIVASGTKMAKPIASDKTYGYLNVADVTDNNGVIELDNTDNTFVFTNSDDGWTIKQKDGRFLYQSGTYNSFNVNAAPTEGQYWTVEAQAADGTFKITNKSVNKYIQFDSAYSSYGSYDSAKGALPALYEMDGEDGGSGGGQGGGGTGSGITVGLAATSFTADTDATYGAGFKYTSSEGIVIAYYKYNSNNDLVNTQSDHIRVYKNAVIVVTAPAGKTIKNLVFNCTYADKTYQMNVLEGGGSTTADTTAKTVTWSGSASKFVGNTVNGQCQFKNVVVTLE